MMTSSDEDSFFDADFGQPNARIDRTKVSCSAEDDEVGRLTREREILLLRRKETEAKLRAEEEQLERQLAEALKKQDDVKLKYHSYVVRNSAVSSSPTEEFIIEEERRRKKLLKLRNSLQREVSTQQTSFDDGRTKSSSLDRAKATLANVTEQKDPDKLVEALIMSQNYSGVQCEQSSDVLNTDTLTSCFPKRDGSLSDSASVSSSTPLTNKEAHSASPMFLSPIETNTSVTSQLMQDNFKNLPQESQAISNQRKESFSHRKVLLKQSSISECESEEYSDSEKYSTARGHLTLLNPPVSSESAKNNQYGANLGSYQLYVDMSSKIEKNESTAGQSSVAIYTTAQESYSSDERIFTPELVDASRQPLVQSGELLAENSSNKSGLPKVPPRKKRVKSQSPQKDINLKSVPVLETVSQSSSKTSVCSLSDTVVEDDSVMRGLPPALSLHYEEDEMLAVPAANSLTIKTATLGKRHVSVEGDFEGLDDAYHNNSTLQINQRQASVESPVSPQNPLSLIMKLAHQQAEPTTSYNPKVTDSDGEGSMSSKSTGSSYTQRSLKKRGKQIKKLIGKAITRVSSIKSKEQDSQGAQTENGVHVTVTTALNEEDKMDDAFVFKGSANSHYKGPFTFDKMKLVQDMSGEHNGPVWIIKFSTCGRLLATGGQDAVIRVWVLKDFYKFFDDMKQKYNETHITPASSSDGLADIIDEASNITSAHVKQEDEDTEESPFVNRIFMSYRGHTADVLDLSWSKNCFLLSSSMDRTVRLWHISRPECLCCFQHIDFVTAIVFHPRDDRYFLSGSLDGRLRFWSIPDKKVALWNEVTGSSRLITAVNFCQNGRFAVVGTYDGRCIFYSTEQLKYFTTINVRSSRGKNASGRKVTGIEPHPHEDKILVTTNDSRLRLYDLRDLSVSCKYKGCTNVSSQIKSSLSHDGTFILCGSEDHKLYFWRTYHQYKLTALRRDRNDFWEAIHAHTAVVTAAIFSPHPNLFFKHSVPNGGKKEVSGSLRSNDTLIGHGNTTDSSKSGKSSADGSWGKSKGNSLTKGLSPLYGYVVVTADYNGSIKVLIKPLN